MPRAAPSSSRVVSPSEMSIQKKRPPSEGPRSASARSFPSPGRSPHQEPRLRPPEDTASWPRYGSAELARRLGLVSSGAGARRGPFQLIALEGLLRQLARLSGEVLVLGHEALAMNVAPCESAIAVIRTPGASNRRSRLAAQLGFLGIVDAKRDASARDVGLVVRDRVDRRDDVLKPSGPPASATCLRRCGLSRPRGRRRVATSTSGAPSRPSVSARTPERSRASRPRRRVSSPLKFDEPVLVDDPRSLWSFACQRSAERGPSGIRPMPARVHDVERLHHDAPAGIPHLAKQRRSRCWRFGAAPPVTSLSYSRTC